MAVITLVSENHGQRVVSYFWETLTNSDTGSVVDVPALADKTIQVFGTFGAGGTLTFQGSCDGTNWATLNDADGNALTVTAAGIYLVRENVLKVRPNVTAGDGTTDLDCYLIAKGS